MNDAVGSNAPRHLCIESRVFCTKTPRDDPKQELKKKSKVKIPKEYVVIRDYSDDFGISYTALKRARERGQIAGICIDGHLCMKKEDIEAYIRLPRKRGRKAKNDVLP